MSRVHVLLVTCMVLLALVGSTALAIAPAWTNDMGGYTLSAPSIYDGRVYLGSDDGKLYSLDLASGYQNWAYNCRQDQYVGDESIMRLHVRPAVYGADPSNVRVYATTSNGYVFAVNLDGTRKWVKHPTTAENGTPALWGGFLYFGNSGQVHKLNAETGKPVDTSEACGVEIETGVSIPGTDLIWFATGYEASGSYIWCLQASDLSVVRAQIPAGWPQVVSSPYVSLNGSKPLLYIGTGNGRLRCIHATSFTEEWSQVMDDAVASSPWVDFASGKVVMGCNDKKLYAFDAATGQNKQTFTADAALKSPVVINGICYIGDIHGKLYAVRLSDMNLVWSYNTGCALTDTAFGEANGHVYLVVGSTDGKVYGFEVQ